MPQAILNQIINQLQILEPSELQQLSQLIQAYLQDREASAQKLAFHQALVSSGLVRQVKHPTFERKMQRPLIPLLGEPVSQTIIEERR